MNNKDKPLKSLSFMTLDLLIVPSQGKVWVGKEVIRISPVNMRVLQVLLQASNHTVSRNELFEKVWPQQEVSDDALTRSISDIRNQLKPFVSQKIIETIPKKGYRWLAEVSVSDYESGNTGDFSTDSTLCESSRPDTEDDKSSKSKELITEQNRVVAADNGRLSFVQMAIVFCAAVVLATGSVLAGISWLSKKSADRVAVYKVTDGINVELQQQISDLITQEILQNRYPLRVVSSSIIDSRPHEAYPFLVHDFNVQWVIEIEMREHHYVLSLLEARTALVSIRQSFSITGDENELKENLKQFIFSASQVISDEY